MALHTNVGAPAAGLRRARVEGRRAKGGGYRLEELDRG